MQKLNLEMAARNGAKTKRDPYDFYATDPKTVEIFLKQLEKDNIKICKKNIWECACGNGHISEVLKQHGYKVYSTDIIERDYPCDFTADFLVLNTLNMRHFEIDTIMTNPPYKDAMEFALRALDLVKPGGLVIFYLKDRFLEGTERYKKIFKNFPPRYVYCHVDRQNMAMCGEFDKYCKNSNTQFFIWCIWQKGYKGETTLRWIK